MDPYFVNKASRKKKISQVWGLRARNQCLGGYRLLGLGLSSMSTKLLNKEAAEVPQLFLGHSSAKSTLNPKP